MLNLAFDRILVSIFRVFQSPIQHFWVEARDPTYEELTITFLIWMPYIQEFAPTIE
jgi:hypothetical protein